MNIRKRLALLSTLLLLSTSACTKADEGADEGVVESVEGEAAEGEAAESEAAEGEAADDEAAEGEAAEGEAAEGEAAGDRPFERALVLPENPPEITVTSPGAAPLQTLRYDVANIEPFALKVTMATENSIQVGDAEPQEQAAPAVTITLSFSEPSVADEVLTMSFSLDSIEADASENPSEAMMMQMMQQQLQAMEFGGTLQMNTRGQLLGGTIRANSENPMAEGFAASVESTLSQVTMLLPAEAVGAGAVWTTTQPIDAPVDIDATQTATYTLTSLTESSLVVDQSITISLPGGEVELPPGPGGQVATLKAFEGSGEGTLTVALNNITPTGDVSITNRMDVEGPLPDGTTGLSKIVSSMTTSLELIAAE